MIEVNQHKKNSRGCRRIKCWLFSSCLRFVLDWENKKPNKFMLHKPNESNSPLRNLLWIKQQNLSIFFFSFYHVICDKKMDSITQPESSWLNWGEVLKHFPKTKVMVIAWLSASESIHYNFLDSSKTITTEV